MGFSLGRRTGRWATRPQLRHVWDYVAAIGVVAGITVVGRLLFGTREPADAAMLYLLGEVFASLLLARGPALLTAVLSVLAFDFFFIPPYLTFAVAALRHVVTFAVMLTVGLVINILMRRLRSQAETSRAQERRTRTLYEMTLALTGTNDRRELAERAAQQVSDAFDADVTVLDQAEYSAELNTAVTQWFNAAHPGPGQGGEEHRPSKEAEVSYLPVPAQAGPATVLRIHPRGPGGLSDGSALLEAFVAQLGMALDRAYLDEERNEARVLAESEQIRSSLLASVSHDLRTPLFVMGGASSTLLELGLSVDPEVRRQLLTSIRDEAERMGQLVTNLLEMTRFGAGELVPNRDWQVLEEIVGSALARMGSALEARDVCVDFPPDLPLVAVDDVLIEQVLINLLQNVVCYTPEDSPVILRAWVADTADHNEVVVEVADAGPGLKAAELDQVFERFYRGSAAAGTRGVGLGLSICRALVEAHGGWIEVHNRPEGGASFRFAIPTDGRPEDILDEATDLGRA